FRETLRELAAHCVQGSGWSILKELSADQERSRIHGTEVAQPAMFALQVGLTALWKHWGITPQAVVGHSMGEVAAAYAAGVLTLQEAVRVIYHRGRLLEKATGLGKMAAARLPFYSPPPLVTPYPPPPSPPP